MRSSNEKLNLGEWLCVGNLFGSETLELREGGREKEKLHHEAADRNENVLYLKHTNVKHQPLWRLSPLLSHTLFACSGRNSKGWIPSSPAGSCRATASSLKKKNKFKTSEDLVAPWLHRWATARSVRCQWSASTGVEVSEYRCGAHCHRGKLQILHFWARIRLWCHLPAPKTLSVVAGRQQEVKRASSAHTRSSCKEMV